MMSSTAAVTLGDDAYVRLNALLEQRFGLHFPDYRRVILQNRLHQRLRALQLATFDDYWLHLTRDTGEEERFISAVTNNETYFFRARGQFDFLFSRGLDMLRDDLVTGGRLRVLSAACSSGEESYTIAFCAAEAGIAMEGVQVAVHGFDIDAERIRAARSGFCSNRSVNNMTDEQVRRYLEQDGGPLYRVRHEYRACTTFAHGNLIDIATFQQRMPFDVVFCRNALIYFSPAAQLRAVQNLAAVLRPGGLLFLGHSESVIGKVPELETVRIGECIAYRRVPA